MRTKKLIIVVLLFLMILIHFNSQAQEEEKKNRFILKIATLTMLEPIYNTFELGLEYRLKEKMALQLQAGYGNQNFHIWEINNTDNLPITNKFNTWRFRSEFRYYLYQLTDAESYYAFDVMYKHSNINELDWFGEGCINQTCSYFILKNQNINKQVIAYHFKLGHQLNLSKHFVLDMYGGIGYRHIWVNTNAPVRQSEIFEEAFFEFIDKRTAGRLNIISFVGGFKLGFRL